MAYPPASSAFPMAAIAALLTSPRYGVQFLTPFAYYFKSFGFLKSLDLRIVGLELGDVPAEFGWDLVLFDPAVE